MIVLSECDLCRLGVLTRVPLCFGRRNPLACAFMRLFHNRIFRGEL